jgi:hypothetical protein
VTPFSRGENAWSCFYERFSVIGIPLAQPHASPQA